MPEDKTIKIENVKLNNLNMSNNDENLKLAPGVLSSFMSGQTDIRDFGISNPEDYTDYDVQFSRFSDPNLDRAKNQSWGEQALHALGRIGLEGAIGEGVSGIGALGELLMMPFEEGETDFNNAIVRLGEGIKESAREAMPIYRTDPTSHWNPSDFGWWADNSVSVGSTLGLLIPATGMVKGFGAIGRGLSALGKTERLASKTGKFAKGMSKALQIYDRTGDAAKYWGNVVGTSVGMRHAENFGESLQTYNTVKEETSTLFNNMSDEEFKQWKDSNADTVEGSDSQDREGVANHIANKAGWHTYKMDASNLMFDMIQVMPLFKGFKYNTRTKINRAKILKAHYESMGKDYTKSVARKVFRQNVAKAITTGTVAQQLSEGVEEMVNAISQQEGVHYGKQLAGTANDAKFGERMGKYLRDPATWEQAFWGVMGGVAFSGGVAGINKARNLINGIPADRADKARLAEIEGRNAELAITAKLLDNVNNNINPYTGQAFEGTKEQIEQASNELHNDIIRDTGLRLGLGAATHGNINLLLEQLESNKFKEEVTNKFKLSDEAQTNSVIKLVKDNIIKAENLYKDYYNKFATEKISQPVKDLLIRDAIWLEHNRDEIKRNQDLTNGKIADLKSKTDYLALEERIRKANEGKGVEESRDLNDSIHHAAIKELGSIIAADLSSTDNETNIKVLKTRLAKYKAKWESQLKDIKNPYKVDELLRGGLDYAIVEHEASNILNEVMLDENSEEITELLGNPKKRADEHLADMKLVAEKKAKENVPVIDKLIDEADTPAKLDAISKRIQELIDNEQLATDIYNPLKLKADAASTVMKRTAKRRENAIKEKDNYIKALRKSANTFNIGNVLAKRKNATFTKQFTKEDLAEIDTVIDEINKSKKKKPVIDEIEATLLEEFIKFSEVYNTIKSDTLVMMELVAQQGQTNDTIKLTAEDFAKFESVKAAIKKHSEGFDKFKSLGKSYTEALEKHTNLTNMVNNVLKGKTVVNLDNYTAPKENTNTTEETITNDELIGAINKIASDYGSSDTLKAIVIDDTPKVDRVKEEQDKLNHAVNTIRLLALQDAGLGRNNELTNSDYSFNKVLEFIYNNMDKSLLTNHKFIDNMRMVYNMNVNSGFINQAQYVNEGLNMDEFINSMEPKPTVSHTDTGVFLMPLNDIGKTKSKLGNYKATTDEAKAMETVMGAEVGDMVEVSVDEEKSGERESDVLQADIKITKKGVLIGYLNRIYSVATKPTMFNLGVPYIVGDNWTDVVIADISKGGFRKEFDLLNKLYTIATLTKSKGVKAFGYVIDEHGLDLVDSKVLLDAININRSKPINRNDNRAEFDKAVLHFANTLHDEHNSHNFTAGGVTNSLNTWNDRIKGNIINGLTIRKKMKDGKLQIPIADKQGGTILKAPTVDGKQQYNNVSNVFGNPDDLVLLHTTSDSTTEISTINGKNDIGYDGEFHKGTIYTIAKTNDSDGTPVFLHTTDIIDSKSKTSTEYGKQVVKYSTDRIMKLVNAKGEFSENDYSTLLKDLQSLILGVDKHSTSKKTSVTFNTKNGKSVSIMISKTITSIWIDGVNTFNTKDTGNFTEELANLLSNTKRNVPIEKDINGNQTTPQYNNEEGKELSYTDIITGKKYKSFTHYAVTTELLVTQNAAIKDGKGNIISHVNPNNLNLTIDGNKSEVIKKVNPPVGNEVTAVTDIVDDLNSPYVDLFKMAKEAGAIFTNDVVEDDTYYAEFNPITKKINITTKFNKLTNDQQSKTIAHEAIHAIVNDKITDDIADKLDVIQAELQKAFNDGTLIIPEGVSKDYIESILKVMIDKNGYVIPSEMLTYAFTDRSFATMLNANKSNVNVNETLWDKFVALIAELLPNTKLTEVRAIMNEVMGISEEVKQEETKEQVEEDDDFGFFELTNETSPNNNFGNENAFVKVVDSGNNDLGTTVAKYMRGKSKAERDFMRSEINNGNIVLKCK